ILANEGSRRLVGQAHDRRPAEQVETALRLQGADKQIERIAGRGENEAANPAGGRHSAETQVAQSLEAHNARASHGVISLLPCVEGEPGNCGRVKGTAGGYTGSDQARPRGGRRIRHSACAEKVSLWNDAALEPS